MGLFGKKKQDEGQDIQDINLDSQLPVKKNQQVAPARKPRKPKEAIKPWGKKERFFVLYVLLFTTLASAFFGLSAREWKLPGLPKLEIKLPDFNSGTIVLEGNKKQVTDAENEKLIKEFKQLTDNLSGVYGFYVIDLETGDRFGVKESDTFQAASLIKLPVMIALYNEKPAGYKEMVQKMGERSDNEAFKTARKILGDAKINAVIEEIGMDDTSLAENETTMEDVGLFFEKLYSNNLLPEDETEEIINSLIGTIYEDHLAAGIPDNIDVAHKYGREVHVVNDAGIIFSENPFVIVIMTKGIVEKEADEIFPQLSRSIFDHSVN